MYCGLDCVLLITFVFCTIVGFYRGLWREAASIFNWLGATYFTIALRPLILNYFTGGKSDAGLFKELFATLGVFLTIMLVISLCSKIICNFLDKIFPKTVDLILGMLFGFAKAYLFMILIIKGLLFFGGNDGSRIVKESQFYKYVYMDLSVVNKVLQESFGDIMAAKKAKQKVDMDAIERGIDELNEESDQYGLGKEKDLEQLDKRMKEIIKDL